jgi:DNA-binding NarL/FixJ family response regulator
MEVPMKATDDRLPGVAGQPAATVERRIVTVFVVEELGAIRDLIAYFVSRLDGFRVVGSSGRRVEAERECARLKPDIALIDWLQHSDTSGVGLAEAIMKCSSGTRVVVFSAASEAHFVNEAIAAGVSGFVVRTATLDTLARTLTSVANGKQYFCPEVAGVLRELLQQSTHGASRTSVLSHREREVLREIAKGRFSKEIASALNLSVFTVENIRRRIMRKTGLKSVAELTLHAVRLRLISSPLGGKAEK